MSRTAPPPAPEPTPAPTWWAIRPTAALQSVVIEQEATISVRSDTGARLDRVASRTEVSFALLAASRRLSGTVSSYVVRTGDQPAASPPGVATPFSFAAESPKRGLQPAFTAPASRDACSSPLVTVAQSLRDLWADPPDSLRVGTTWSDSAVFSACRGGVVLAFEVSRAFRVVSARAGTDGVVLQVARMHRARVSGMSARGADTTRISGEGAGDAALDIGAADARLLGARGVSTLELVIETGVRFERIRQSATLRITPTLPR